MNMHRNLFDLIFQFNMILSIYLQIFKTFYDVIFYTSNRDFLRRLLYLVASLYDMHFINVPSLWLLSTTVIVQTR